MTLSSPNVLSQREGGVKTEHHKMPSGVNTYLGRVTQGADGAHISLWRTAGLYDMIPEGTEVSLPCYVELTKHILFWKESIRDNIAGYNFGGWIAILRHNHWTAFEREMLDILRKHKGEKFTPLHVSPVKPVKMQEIREKGWTSPIGKAVLAQNLSLTEFAALVGATVASASTWCRGVSTPKSEEMRRDIEKLLSIKIDPPHRPRRNSERGSMIDIAGQIGVSYNTVYRWMKGQTGPRDKRMEKKWHEMQKILNPAYVIPESKEPIKDVEQFDYFVKDSRPTFVPRKIERPVGIAPVNVNIQLDPMVAGAILFLCFACVTVLLAIFIIAFFNLH